MDFGGVITAMVGLLFVIGLILILYLLVRKLPALGGVLSKRGGNLKILSQRPIVGRSFLVEVSWLGDVFLLLVTPTGSRVVGSRRSEFKEAMEAESTDVGVVDGYDD